MNFQHIEHINDILPYIKDEKSILVMNKVAPNGHPYTVIDYVVVTDSTFGGDGPRLECRGIAFDGISGKIIRRPLHKFFNYGEKLGVHQFIDLSRRHFLLPKLDGSMIAPMIVGDMLYWGTRAGVTDIGERVREWLTYGETNQADYIGFAVEMIAIGYTPIFEYIGPDNRIVLRYEKRNLILTQMRDMISGAYLTYDQMCYFADRYSIPVNRPLDASHASMDSIVEYVKPLQGEEGLVVWTNYDFIKIKADEYLKIHRAKDTLQFEKNVLKVVLSGQEDDLIAVLPPEDARAVRAYADAVNRSILGVSQQLQLWVDLHAKGKSRKDIALEILGGGMKKFSPVLFKMLDGKAPMATMTDYLLTFTSSENKVEQIRDYITAKWHSIILEEA